MGGPPVRLHGVRKSQLAGPVGEPVLKFFRSGRVKDCSICVLTLAIVAGVPIMASVSVMLFF